MATSPVTEFDDVVEGKGTVPSGAYPPRHARENGPPAWVRRHWLKQGSMVHQLAEQVIEEEKVYYDPDIFKSCGIFVTEEVAFDWKLHIKEAGINLSDLNSSRYDAAYLERFFDPENVPVMDVMRLGDFDHSNSSLKHALVENMALYEKTQGVNIVGKKKKPQTLEEWTAKFFSKFKKKKRRQTFVSRFARFNPFNK